MEILCFSADVHQCNIACSVVHVHLFIYYYDSFLPTRVAADCEARGTGGGGGGHVPLHIFRTIKS